MANDDRPTQSAHVICVGWLELDLRWRTAAQPTTAHLDHNPAIERVIRLRISGDIIL